MNDAMKLKRLRQVVRMAERCVKRNEEGRANQTPESADLILAERWIKDIAKAFDLLAPELQDADILQEAREVLQEV